MTSGSSWSWSTSMHPCAASRCTERTSRLTAELIFDGVETLGAVGVVQLDEGSHHRVPPGCGRRAGRGHHVLFPTQNRTNRRPGIPCCCANVLLPSEPVTTLVDYLGTDAGGAGIERARTLGAARTIDGGASLGTAWTGRWGFPTGEQVGRDRFERQRAALRGVQRRRRRAGYVQGPGADRAIRINSSKDS